MNNSLVLGVLARRGLLCGIALALAACATSPTSNERNAELQEHMNAGLVFAQNGKHSDAISEFVKALTLDPRNADAHFRVAASQVALGKASPAMDAYRRALALQPEHAGALEGLGLLLLQEGKTDLARAPLEKAVQLDRASWRSLNGLGVMADLQQDYQTAEAHYLQALEVSPNSPMLLNNLGYSLYLDGQLDAAAAQFQAAIALDSEYRQAWTNLGLVLARKGQYREAAGAFAQAMDEAKAAFTTASFCLMDGQLDSAEEYFRRAIERSPSYYREAHDGLLRVSALRPGRMRPSSPLAPTDP